jgi:P pilus assembly chaperone PapD
LGIKKNKFGWIGAKMEYFWLANHYVVNLHKLISKMKTCSTSFPLFTKVVMILFLGCLMVPFTLHGQGDLLITPRRVVFEGNKDRQEITLANTGNDTARYTVSFVQYRMTEEGTFEQITEPDPGQNFADPYLRYFPRTVTLGPKESQVLRMQLRRTPDMVAGEYRSHMYFRAVPEEKPLGEEDQLEDTTAIGIRLTPIFGITIPIIVRVGELKSTITLTDIALVPREDTTLWMNVTFRREGNQSVYGDLTVEYVLPDGNRIDVGIVRGIAVYTPNSTRQFSMELQKPDGVDYTKGKLVIRYSSSSEAKPEVYAETELKLVQ